MTSENNEDRSNRSGRSAGPRRLLGIGAVIAVLAGGLLVDAPRLPGSSRRLPPTLPASTLLLVEEAARSGLDFEHVPVSLGSSGGAEFMAWLLGPGLAVDDIDGDGLADVFVTGGGKDRPFVLYRNLGGGRFEDGSDRVAASWPDGIAPLRPLFFDFDNDGDADLFVTSTGCSKLFRNDDGRFVELKGALEHCAPSVASNVVDFDRDGLLDLIVADLVPSGEARDLAAWLPNSRVKATNDGRVHLFRNVDGRVFEVVPEAGGLQAEGWVQSVAVHDLDTDGRADVYLARAFNDRDALYGSRPDGTFVDDSFKLAEWSGRNSSGATAADFRNIGLYALFVAAGSDSAFVPGNNALLDVQNEQQLFDAAEESGVTNCGWAWSPVFADLDNDGWQDLFVSNGMRSGESVTDPAGNGEADYGVTLAALAGSGNELPVDPQAWPSAETAALAGGQRDCLFVNRQSKFRDVGERLGLATEDGRAVAAIDIEGDGRVSLLRTTYNGPLRLYRNRSVGGSWIGFRLEGANGQRGGLGAEVLVTLTDGRRFVRTVSPANGYLSQHDGRVHFGLGREDRIEQAVVKWPSGREQTVWTLEAGRYVHVVEREAGPIDSGQAESGQADLGQADRGQSSD